MEFTCVFHVLHKFLYHENCKISFLWHCDNGKTDCNTLNLNHVMYVSRH